MISGAAGPSISASNIVFAASYSGGSGVYAGAAGTSGITKVVDTTDIAPGQGEFTGAGTASISGNTVAFFGSFSGGSGVYTTGLSTGPITKIVDTTDNAPGQSVPFTFFFSPSVSGSDLAFPAFYSGGSGIYSAKVAQAGASKIADTTDTAPGHGKFSSFDRVSISESGGRFVFTADAVTGGRAIYLSGNGSIVPVISVNDTLFGGTVIDLETGPGALDGNQLAFRYQIQIQSGLRSGIAVADISSLLPEPTSLAAITIAISVTRRRGFRRKRKRGGDQKGVILTSDR